MSPLGVINGVKSLYKKNKWPKKGNQIMHGKAIWKLGIADIVKVSMDFTPGPQKTQSFMKNGGQKKCLDKALLW